MHVCSGGGRNAGKGKARGAGTAGLISSALTVLGQLISAKRTRQRPDAVRIQGVDSRKADDFLAAGRVLPINKGSLNRQSGNVPFLAFVSIEKCTGCGICAQVCPVGAIVVEQAASVDIKGCTGCGQCVTECPQDALVLRRARETANSACDYKREEKR